MEISKLLNLIQSLTVAPTPWALLGPFSIALSLWGMPLSYSAPRTIVKVLCIVGGNGGGEVDVLN